MTDTPTAPAQQGGERTHGMARTVAALARLEGFRLITGPLFFGFGVLTILGLSFSEGELTDLNQAFSLGLVFFPLAAGVLLATNIASLRARRDRTDELIDVMPAAPAARTVAHVLAGVYALIAGTLLVTGWILWQRAGGAIGWPDPAEALMGPVLLLGAVACGVLLARLIPSTFAAFPGIVAIGMVTGQLNSMDGTDWRLEWLAPWPGTNDGLPAAAWPRPTWLHLLYLLALTAVITLLAVLRHQRSRRVIAGLVAAMTLTTLTGVAHARPPSDRDVATAVAWLTSPPADCRESSTMRLCAFQGYEQLLDRWEAAIAPVLEQLPATGRPRIEVIQRPEPSTFDAIPRVVRDALPPHVVDGSWRRDGAVHPGLGWATGSITSVTMSLQAASWAVGLPIEPLARSPRDAALAQREGREIGNPMALPCFSGGQARAVVALWLTGVAHSGAATFAPVFNEDPDDGMTGGDHIVAIAPPDWLAEMPLAVTWAPSDIRAAMALLERPDAGDAIRARWTSLTDPATTSEQLARAFDLTAQPPPTAPGRTC